MELHEYFYIGFIISFGFFSLVLAFLGLKKNRFLPIISWRAFTEELTRFEARLAKIALVVLAVGILLLVIGAIISWHAI